MSLRWDSRNLRTVSTHLSTEEAEELQQICALQHLTPYALVREWLRDYIKRSLGGSNQPQNLICLCWKCHAVAHGTMLPDYPDYVTPEYIDQAVCEYLSDYYAGDWYPYGDD